ncbi:MAG TPA: hypothetical protein PLC52_04440 [Anaerolineales bacterium]|nr:hypothetical protein [Anaerolineales bacterium]HRQ92099.1 hypothetical protein [Anaerolineales bacterium]
MNSNQSAHPLRQFILPALVLFVLLLFTYARFFSIPYIGFQYDPSGEIVDVFTPEASRALELGDLLLEANGVTQHEYRSNLSTPWFFDVHPGDVLDLRVRTNGEERQLQLTVPGFNLPEFTGRLINTWWLSYVFWFAGAIIYFHVRPQDVRWRLLVVFCYVTAVWLMAGSLSRYVVFFSPVVFRTGIWLSLPVYLHLHWNFPRPFPRLPRLVWAALYAIGIGFAILQALGRLDPNWFGYALFVAVVGSLLMLLVRFFANRAERREVGFLLGSFAIALIPTLMLGLATAQDRLPLLSHGSVFSLVAYPGAYLYVVYRRQLGGMELRANRLISVYLFLVLLFTGTLILVSLFAPRLENPQEIAIAILATGLIVSLFNIFAFERFQRFVERTVLKIPQPPENMLQGFANLISTSLTRHHLGRTLEEQVLPGLLVRQSALFHFQARSKERQLIYRQGIEFTDLPSEAVQQRLLSLGTRPLDEDGVPAWVQMSLPVRAGNQTLGLWLLGRKDPDDYYSYLEERLLRSLADQTAIALVNIQQADRLHALHQRDIDQQEDRSAFLARELHDDVLAGINELVALAQQGQGQETPLHERHQELSDTVRQLIYRLRPAMLDFGLYRALTELADTITLRLGGQVQISLMLPESNHMYDGHVAEHAYRIVQQAVENAIRHGQPQFINISGVLEPERIDVLVEDDGKGFDVQGPSLPDLLRAQHFGLASMNERAALIGAQLTIHSKLGEGTQVRLQWKNE